MATLPVIIYNYAGSPYADWQHLAWAGALVLVTVMFCLSLTARYFGRTRQNG